MAKKTKMIFGEEAKKALQTGIDTVAKAVAVTMGPGGRLVILPGVYGQRVITRDGVTVARSIQLENEFENEAAQLVKQVAAKTNDLAGDGTTTSVVLAQALVNEGLKYVATGGNPIAVKKGIEQAVELVTDYITSNKQGIAYSDKELIKFVATISGSDPEIGNLVADAFTSVGADGVVTFEEGKGAKTTLEVSEGLSFDRGFLTPFFVTDANSRRVEFTDCKVLVWEGRINTAVEIIPILESISAKKTPLLIICDDMDGEALATAVINNANGKIQCVAVKAPGFGERKKGYLQDIAIATGAKFFNEELKYKLERVLMEDLGDARRVVVTSDSTTLIDAGGSKETLETHIAGLKTQLAEADSKWDIEKLTERVAKLSAGVAVIKVGAGTEAELGEKKYRFEDAISATKSALEMGIVPGAGNTLAGAAQMLSKSKERKGLPTDELAGFDIVCKALLAPARIIASNAGYSGDSIVAELVTRVKSGKINMGFDSRSGKWVDLIKTGIIDPAKVTKAAVENAASIAVLVLTTETLIVNMEDPKQDQGGY
jgi:chaperonin GroEL